MHGSVLAHNVPSSHAMTTTLLSRATRIAATVVVALATASSPASAQQGRRLDAMLQARARQLAGRSRVIVQFKDAPDVRAISDLRGSVGRRLSRLRAQVAEVDNSALAALADDPRVEYVALDRAAFATMERTGAAIGATAARGDFDVTGHGVGVAVIDSGVNGWHDDLYVSTPSSDPNRVVHVRDFTDSGRFGQFIDAFGHGTHVAGIIAGNGVDSGGRRTGIAPGAHLIGLKVLDASGSGYISDVIAALDYAISIKDVYNVRIINLSVGAAITESYLTDPLTLAAKRAVDAGIVVVAAAGNFGRGAAGAQFGGITAPGNAPWVLTVGASSHQGTAKRSDDVMAAFSSRGPTWIDFAAKPDLLAPGVGIESLSDPVGTLYAKYPQLLLNGTTPSWYRPYMSLTGTSMAAPVVSGTIALMLEANPALTPNAVKAILEYTAQARPADSPLASGAGLLNARGALRLARYFARPGGSLGSPQDQIAGEWIPWSRQLIWGNYILSGGVLSPAGNAWAVGQTWGARATASDAPIVWGVSATDGNIIWSTGASQDGNIIWSTGVGSNVVWGQACGGKDCRGVIWGARSSTGTVWGTGTDDANIIWSTGASQDGNIIWSTGATQDGNIIWSTSAPDQVVWGAAADKPPQPRDATH